MRADAGAGKWCARIEWVGGREIKVGEFGGMVRGVMGDGEWRRLLLGDGWIMGG